MVKNVAVLSSFFIHFFILFFIHRIYEDNISKKKNLNNIRFKCEYL